MVLKIKFLCQIISNSTDKLQSWAIEWICTDKKLSVTRHVQMNVFETYYYYCYHHHHRCLLYAGYPYTYSRDKPFPQGIHCCSYSVFVVYGASISSSCVGSFVLLHLHFPKYVCSVQYGCFLQFLNVMVSWCVAHVFSE